MSLLLDFFFSGVAGAKDSFLDQLREPEVRGAPSQRRKFPLPEIEECCQWVMGITHGNPNLEIG